MCTCTQPANLGQITNVDACQTNTLLIQLATARINLCMVWTSRVQLAACYGFQVVVVSSRHYMFPHLPNLSGNANKLYLENPWASICRPDEIEIQILDVVWQLHSCCYTYSLRACLVCPLTELTEIAGAESLLLWRGGWKTACPAGLQGDEW